MPIVSLSESTVRAIGASLVLNDATSVVKELIDNALDARATSIAIEISADTLDLIQVRDNGIGIGVEDRQFVCKHGCTSKIRSIEDLDRLGGSSLGFRGEALASVAELSEVITLTTRVDGEMVGSTIKYNPKGTIISAASASHPVGTTIRVQHFLKSLPVRRQTALKAPAKTLSATKKLLFSYAFARPTTRFSFKVLKGKSDRFNWTFSPTSKGDLAETASKVIGKDMASCCRVVSHSPDDEEPPTGDAPSPQMSALMLSPEHDIPSANNPGHFITVDGRPMNSSRGPMHNLVKEYRSHFRSAYQAKHSASTSLDPFICLHIRCPPETYDVNVEPAKDDVLFSDSQRIQTIFKELLESFYGRLETKNNVEVVNASRAEDKTSQLGSFGILLARKKDDSDNQPLHNDRGDDFSEADTNTQYPRDEAAEQNSLMHSPHLEEHGDKPDNVVPTLMGTVAFRNMFAVDEEDLIEEPASLTSDYHFEKEDEEDRVRATNPWLLARMNAPAHKRTSQSSSSPRRPTDEMSHPQQDLRSSSPQRAPQSVPIPLFNDPQLLPTPDTSPRSLLPYQNPGPPLRPWARGRERDETQEAIPRPRQLPTSSASGMNLSGWLQRGQTDRDRFESPSSGSSQTFESTRKPFKSPIRVSHLLQRNNPHAELSPQSQESSTLGLRASDSIDDDDLADILAFEARKKEMSKKHRQRQAQLRMGNQFINPAELAKMQRDASGTASVDPTVNEAQNSMALCSQRSGYASKFGPPSSPTGDANGRSQLTQDRMGFSQSSQQSLPRLNNPHRNRYLAATRSLMQPNTSNKPSTTRRDALSGDEVNQNERRRPDPLTQPIDPQHQEPTHESTKTPFQRPRRIPSHQLGLESIPTNAMTHNLVTTIPLSTPATPISSPSNHSQVHLLSRLLTTLKSSDTYILTTGTHDGWTHFSAQTDDALLSKWERRTESFIAGLYRTDSPRKAGPDDTTGVGESEGEGRGIQHFNVDLRRAIRARAENLSVKGDE